MLDIKFVTLAADKLINKLKDTRYFNCNANERLTIIRAEIAGLRSELLDVKDARSAEICSKKLKNACIEYERLLKSAREQKIV